MKMLMIGMLLGSWVGDTLLEYFPKLKAMLFTGFDYCQWRKCS